MVTDVYFVPGSGFDGHTEFTTGEGGCDLAIAVGGGGGGRAIGRLDGGWIVGEPGIEKLVWK